MQLNQNQIFSNFADNYLFILFLQFFFLIFEATCQGVVIEASAMKPSNLFN